MIASQIFSSVGIGLLIGILLGLSASPVVGLVVGSVTALLASLIGVKFPSKDENSVTTKTNSQEQQKLIGIRAGFFGLTCVIGIFIGIYLRTHNVLSPPEPTLKQQVEELTSIGVSTKKAIELVVAGATLTEASDSNTDKTNKRSSNVLKNTVLFSIDSVICEKIAIDRFVNMSAAIQYYRTLDQPGLLKISMAVNQQKIDEKVKKDIMQSVVEALCTTD